jgi:tetratricopeptide (TPR) repeat protein
MRRIFLILAMAVLLTGSVVCGESVATLLERGVYLEETKGDLTGALAVYSKIADQKQAKRQYLSEALYRSGDCYLKNRNEVKARFAFQSLINEYPEQTILVSQAKQRMPAANITAPSAERINYGDLSAVNTFMLGKRAKLKSLTLKPAPWSNMELSGYNITNVSDQKPVGSLLHTVEMDTKDGRSIWRIRSTKHTSHDGRPDYTMVEANRLSFAPIHSVVKIGGKEIVSKYVYNGVKYYLDGNRDSGGFVTAPTDTVVYDIAQLHYIIRRLPLKDAYKTSFYVFNPEHKEIGKCTIEVVDSKQEKYYTKYTASIALSYGSGRSDFHYFSLTSPGRPNQGNSDWWIDTGITKLTSIEGRKIQSDHGTSTRWGSPNLEVPKLWAYTGILNSNKPEHCRRLIHIIPLRRKAWGGIHQMARSDDIDSAQQLVDAEMKRRKKEAEKYKGNSIEKTEIDNMDAVKYKAEYTEQDERMVEYGACLLAGKWCYQVVFRMEKDDFDSMKGDFDSIIASMKTYESDFLAFEKKAKKNPKDKDIWNRLGCIQFDMKRYSAAKASFDHCLSLNPNDPEALYGLGWTKTKQKKHKAAVSTFKQMLKLKPTSKEAIEAIIVNMMVSREYDAIPAYCNMLEHPSIRSNMSSIKTWAGYNKAIENDPKWREGFGRSMDNFDRMMHGGALQDIESFCFSQSGRYGNPIGGGMPGMSDTDMMGPGMMAPIGRNRRE